MDNSLYEHLIARQNGLKTNLMKALLITLWAVLGIFVLFFFPSFLFVVIILGVLAYIFVLPRFNIEYEYTLLYQDLDIDTIYNKAKRKKTITLDLREAEVIAPLTSKRLDAFRPTNTLNYSTQNPDDTPYAIIIPLNKNLTRVLIQPNAEMITYLRNAAPRVTFTD